MIKLNGSIILPTIFPDKTSQIWKVHVPNRGPAIEIEWDFESEDEFMHVAQLKHLVSSESNRPVCLYLPYLPYGRQDKMVSSNATFALRTFANLINSLEFDHVSCFDPHSDVASSSLNNFSAVYPNHEIINAAYRCGATLFCYPDFGALNKYTRVMHEHPFIHGKKIRDQSSGVITHYDLVGDPSGQNVLIVDDICDGGATFIFLVKALLLRGATEVNLYVSHGIFSKGTDILKQAGIKNIFTKDGIKE